MGYHIASFSSENDDNLFIPKTYLSTLLDTVLNSRITHQEFDMQVTFHSMIIIILINCI